MQSATSVFGTCAASVEGVGTVWSKRLLFEDIVRTLSLALDLDDGQKLLHSWRTAFLSLRMARYLEHVDPGLVSYAALLHDIGGMGMTDHLLHSMAGGLPSAHVRHHPVTGATILESFPIFRPLVPIVVGHHERYDGQGFPFGWAGEENLREAQLVSLADALDVDLRFRAPQDRHERARQLIEAGGGTIWSSEIAAAGRELLRTEPRVLVDAFDEATLEREIRHATYVPPALSQYSYAELLVQLLSLLARVIDGKHGYTRGHSERVAFHACQIATVVNHRAVNRWDVLWAGLLHDIGKIRTPRKFLDKPGRLTEVERGIVQRHAAASEILIARIADLAHLAFPAAAHHERYDGAGYPRGLSGDEIPLIGRIISYADAYDAMTSDRAYRAGMAHDVALERLAEAVGNQLDPHLAPSALRALADQKGQAPSSEDFNSLLALWSKEVDDGAVNES